MAKIGRNDRCPCGSGKKYKQCCLARDEADERRTFVAAPAVDHLPHHHPRLCKDCNARIDAAANEVTALIDAGKLDEAEHAAQQLIEGWPDMHDGFDCLGMVHEARGDNRQAAEYYRNVIDFARQDPSLYDPEFQDYYLDLIDRLDPIAARSARMGALTPKPPGYLSPMTPGSGSPRATGGDADAPHPTTISEGPAQAPIAERAQKSYRP